MIPYLDFLPDDFISILTYLKQLSSILDIFPTFLNIFKYKSYYNYGEDTIKSLFLA